ncbi:MAG: hypothetical protein DMG35_01235 [Acidobacteria bacterium]|nr:MAG: hypothetical protein DMG35_01235 [Acidobacteriota bacterium]
MKQLAKFLRSVLPADWSQLIFLFGVVCLYIARILRSLLAKGAPSSSLLLLFTAHMPLLAGVAGYFICFWPGKHPARRILYWVCLPALGGLSLTYGLFLYYGLGPSSAHGTGTAYTVGWALSAVWSLGPEFHFALLGLILVALFAWRLATGYSSLPLALPESSILLSDDPVSWRRVQILVWILVALAGGPLFLYIALILTVIDYLLVVLIPWIARFARLAGVSTLVAKFILGIGAIGGYLLVASASQAMVLGFALLTLGKEGWKNLRRSIRLPKPEYFLVALAFPFAIATFIAVVWHLFPLVQIENQTKVLPGIFFAAFLEEIIIRGLLQPRFIRSYGLLRGIFLVGIVWAAAHFYGDFFPHFSHGNVLLQIGWRLLDGVVFSFILGWLTLRTRSILPATVAHGIENVLVVPTFGPRFLMLALVRNLLWGALAYVLFRYWPVWLEGEPDASAAEVTSQPGT